MADVQVTNLVQLYVTTSGQEMNRVCSNNEQEVWLLQRYCASAPPTIYCQQLDFLVYNAVTDSSGLAAVNFMQLALKAAISSEIMSSEGQWAIQGHSRSPILVPIENLYANNTDLYPVLPHF